MTNPPSPRLAFLGWGLAPLLVAATTAWGAPPVAAEAPADPLAFQKQVRPLLEKHCFECHGREQQEMGHNFETFGDERSILGRRDLWRKIRETLEAGDMPPDAKASGFSTADRQQVIAWIRDRVETIDRKNPAYQNPGPNLIRQLTRAEYNNSIRDLLGFSFDAAAAGGIPRQEVDEGYVNLGGGQPLDDVLLEKYLTAADGALKALFEANRKPQREALFIARPSEKLPAKAAAATVLERFVGRAYRRPAEADEIARLVTIVEKSLAAGDDYELTVRKALKPVLVSPHFLFRLERDQTPAGAAGAYRVSDHELAVRLSYFLWATMPDDELRALADAGKLSQRETLDAQVKRMLADPKAGALTEHFAMQWLQLNKLRRALPSRNAFPSFTPTLKNAMEQEARTFFDNLRTGNRSVLELLDADYTYVNEELAKHYGLAEVKGTQMRRVDLRPQDHRGGLVGMSGPLTLTSHTDRTKPTARGKWILEVVLGTPPSPPPANVSDFKPQPKDKPAPKNFRERLAAHANQASCAACHKKIDPLGFALENFDAIGGWREQLGGAEVDNAGRLPGGSEFKGLDGLKKVLGERQDQFVRNVSVQLLTYALGRNLEYTDELALLEIGESLRSDEYRFGAWVRGVVHSRPFQYRQSRAVSP